MKRWAAIFAVAGLLALAYCAFEYFRASRYQATEKSRFARETDSHAQPDAGAVPAGPAEAPVREHPRRGDAMALLTIPRIGLSSVVLEGAEARELKLGPGHIASTPLPGEGGNFAVAGHRDTFFHALRLIRTDDVVQVRSRGGEFQYRVVSLKIVSPKDVQVLDPTGRETLTLVTCYPFDFVGAAPKRFIVQADCEDCPGRTANPH
ncbi:MAG TPA: class D sortase [Bryobacteraceae bacterium]|nr:class D sortase [Bryobacteraceae bacterium]